MRSSSQKDCFVAAPFGAVIDVLVQELERRGFRVRDGRTLALSGRSVLESVRTAVNDADLICAVLPARPSPNAYLEIGLAVGLSKPIALFAEIGTDLPSDLAGLTYSRAALQDSLEIGRFLDVFLKHHPKQPRRSASRPKQIVSKLSRSVAVQARDALAASRGATVEQVFRDLFSEVGYVVSEPYGERKESVDFAVWIDGLQGAVGNPIPVEVKANVSSLAALDAAEAQLRRHLEQVGTKLGILIYTSQSGREFPAVSSAWPLVLRLTGTRAIDSLATGSFESEILKMRNRVAHGLPPS